MTSTPKIYRKLAGRKPGFIDNFSLWMGPDHLLSVRNKRFFEEYRRFYFTDIQAILLQKSPRAFLRQAILLLPVLALAALQIWGHAKWYWFSIPAAGVLAIVIPWLVRGASSVCHLQTAVSVEPLPSLRHWRSAQRAVAEIRAAVERVQGAADLAQLSLLDTSFPPLMPHLAAPPPLPFRDRAYTHLLGFAFLLLTGAIGMWNAFQPGVAEAGWLLAGHLAAFGLLMASMILHDRRSLGKPLAAMVSAAMVYLVAAISVSGWALSVRTSMTTMDAATRQMLQRVMESTVAANASAAIGLTLGLAGAVMIWIRMPQRVEAPLTIFTGHRDAE